jgi:hypothetical protein
MSNDDLHNLLADFDEVADDKPAATASESARPAGRRKGKRVYRSALDEAQTNRRQMAQATGKKATLAGQYVRRSFTFRPDQLERIEQTASQLGLSQNDLLRWFTDIGIEAVAQGERPPLAEEIRRKYDPGLS